jgi:hypothetical protein
MVTRPRRGLRALSARDDGTVVAFLAGDAAVKADQRPVSAACRPSLAAGLLQWLHAKAVDKASAGGGVKEMALRGVD